MNQGKKRYECYDHGIADGCTKKFNKKETLIKHLAKEHLIPQINRIHTLAKLNDVHDIANFLITGVGELHYEMNLIHDNIRDINLLIRKISKQVPENLDIGDSDDE
jgi:hypothetical protein